ncbi:MAG: DUF4369 domain-containing protein [Bacteroidaceae bacterium]|nr:DUF4369 domain-containing protein [Bacteroidaceae bacterium]
MFICMLSCCSSADVYHIDGYIDCADEGDTVTILHLDNDNSHESLSQAIVKDGKFYFDGTVNGCVIANIHVSARGKELCSTFFIEKGKIELHVGDSSIKATGTPFNELYNIIEDSITYYTGRLDEIEDICCSEVPDSGLLAQLGAAGIGLQEKLVDFLHRRITENIGNPLGIYLFVVYNGIFSVEELHSLSADDGQLNDMMLGIVHNNKKADP